jgi:hypothetical protein
MNELSPGELITYIVSGECRGTGYIRYLDQFTHNECIDVYINGKCVHRYQTNDVDEVKRILKDML